MEKYAPNLKDLASRDVVSRSILKEILAGRVAGPFESSPLLNLRVSPIGLVPKKTKGEFRLIHHLSFLKYLLFN